MVEAELFGVDRELVNNGGCEEKCDRPATLLVGLICPQLADFRKSFLGQSFAFRLKIE